MFVGTFVAPSTGSTLLTTGGVGVSTLTEVCTVSASTAAETSATPGVAPPFNVDCATPLVVDDELPIVPNVVAKLTGIPSGTYFPGYNVVVSSLLLFLVRSAVIVDV